MIAPIQKCYLGKFGDDANAATLYTHQLIVSHKGKLTEIPLDQIVGLNVSRKKLIIPLVVGGIGTCMSWLALSLGWYHYHTNLLVTFLFFGWMYYGFLGRDGLDIRLKKHQLLFLIQTNGHMLHGFLSAIRQRKTISTDSLQHLTYHLSTAESWKEQITSPLYKHESLETEGFIHTSTADQIKISHEKYFSSTESLVLLAIDTRQVEAKSKNSWVESRNALFFHIYGKLNKSAIVGAAQINNSVELAQVVKTIS